LNYISSIKGFFFLLLYSFFRFFAERLALVFISCL
jgi:hypothetical protein